MLKNQLMLILMMLPALCQAIVIRHDRPDRDYRTSHADYPYVARFDDGAGVLIGRQWLLTAAHVAQLHSQGGLRHAVLNGTRHEIDRVVLHPDWVLGGPHDVALVRLAAPTERVEPVGIYQGDDEAGKTVQFVGWGDTGNGREGVTAQDGHMRAAQNKVERVDDLHVFFAFDAPPDGLDLEGVSGPGDSGGPALIEEHGKIWTLGVSAFADGEPGRYGVVEIYPRVSRYAEWIRQTMANPPTPDTPTFPDSDLGKVADGFFRAYHRGEDAYVEFMQNHSSPAFLQKRPENRLRKTFRTLQSEHFGKIEIADIQAAGSGNLIVFVRSQLGPAGQFEFELDGDGLLGSIQVARLD
ncbi:MAG: trypsin-like serine protease [Xanthomonadales bacterium]|nr:trypsin-like serine protease [Xanthomonadales bacterium]